MENCERLRFLGFALFPLWESLKFHFTRKFPHLKSNKLFSCTNIIPALIINYTINCGITLKFLKSGLVSKICLKSCEKLRLLSPFELLAPFFTQWNFMYRKCFVLKF